MNWPLVAAISKLEVIEPVLENVFNFSGALDPLEDTLGQFMLGKIATAVSALDQIIGTCFDLRNVNDKITAVSLFNPLERLKR